MASQKIWYYFRNQKLVRADDSRFEKWIFFHIPPNSIIDVQELDPEIYEEHFTTK